MTPVHVNIASDDTLGISVHMALPPAPVGTWPSVEVNAKHNNEPGKAKHKITTNVFHRGQGIVLHGHDCGMGIADEAPPIVGRLSGYLPIVQLKSSRKVMFAASTVKANGTPIGGVALDTLPMLTCGDPIPLPSVFSLTSGTNSVFVGFSDSDLERGWEDIVDAVSVELICFVVSIVTMDPKLFGAGDVVEGVLGHDPLKSTISAGVGLKRSIQRSAASGWEEPIVLKAETGGSAVGGSLGVGWTPATGETDITHEGNAGPFAWTAGAKHDGDGNWVGTGDIPADLFD
jgi:hypothetical protein